MSEGPRRRIHDSALVLAVLLLLVGTVREWKESLKYPGIDFYHYWVVATVVGRGDIPSIYDHGSRAAIGQEFLHRALAEGSDRQRAAARFREVIEPTATPFLFATLSPFARLDYDAAFKVFLAVSLASLLAGVFVLGKILELPPLVSLVTLVFLVTEFQPVNGDLSVGNVGLLQLGMIALFAWLSSRGGTARQAAAGAVLGAATAFKPSLAAVAPLLLASWALRGQWRRVVVQASGFLAGGLAGVVVGAWFFGELRAWLEWLTALGGLPGMPIDGGNISVLAVVESVLGIRLGLLPAFAAAAAVLGALAMRRRRSAAGPPAEAAADDIPVLAAALLAILIGSPLVWVHYLILAVPAVLVALKDFRWPWLTVAALVAMAIDPLNLLLVLSGVMRAIIAMSGVTILFAAMLARIAAPAANEAPPTAAAQSPP